ncbi:diaminopimelate epimerase [Acetatifactor muris]|jgi:diaminopimelate epimerase|uniref:Diaminopimelate epimerase n=1 Tax=Acetatifactor muris TaxID=879566 RepID=A0A2K4ZLJ8_9FIRM|nr:diaminopimelate epimerase [Acetatifactor muris]MCI8800309.1 diaminopimelate epimerase [Lachnospiraceae bacterium]MCR2049906.1 diaminopimelate epimerase [Acetatifactor muris]SOY31320.1 Diaminopimelate epimerase [Acetatifactor muris]
MKFTKMHGCGNDYIYVNGFREQVAASEKPELARRLSDRHFGIGSDGLIFINPSSEADFEMEMYNADGSRGEMCGNGIRCVAKYVYDKGLTDSEHISVVSAGKVKYLDLTVEKDPEHPKERGTVTKVRVNMGSPILDPKLVPVKAEGEQAVNEPITVDGREYHMTCVSMGNPHAVIFTKGVAELNLEQMGPLFEHHDRFPARTNTEFVEILDRKTCFMRVWERGSGETLACGTGCCAVAVACVLNHLTGNVVTVKLPGGELLIEWDREENVVYMTGPAVTVFEGEVPEGTRGGENV